MHPTYFRQVSALGFDEEVKEQMNESHFTEIERVMRRVSRARSLAEETLVFLKKEGAELHLIRAMEQAVEDLDAANSKILKGAHYGRPEDQGRLIA